MMTALQALKAALAEIPGLAVVDGKVSCKIGKEQNISPAHFPMIRIVPQILTPGRGYGERTADTQIIFGMRSTEAGDGLEQVYADMFELEAAILAVLRTMGVKVLRTETDRDAIPAYKQMAIVCDVRSVTA